MEARPVCVVILIRIPRKINDEQLKQNTITAAIKETWSLDCMICANRCAVMAQFIIKSLERNGTRWCNFFLLNGTWLLVLERLEAPLSPSEERANNALSNFSSLNIHIFNGSQAISWRRSSAFAYRWGEMNNKDITKQGIRRVCFCSAFSLIPKISLPQC